MPLEMQMHWKNMQAKEIGINYTKEELYRKAANLPEI